MQETQPKKPRNRPEPCFINKAKSAKQIQGGEANLLQSKTKETTNEERACPQLEVEQEKPEKLHQAEEAT